MQNRNSVFPELSVLSKNNFAVKGTRWSCIAIRLKFVYLNSLTRKNIMDLYGNYMLIYIYIYIYIIYIYIYIFLIRQKLLRNFFPRTLLRMHGNTSPAGKNMR